MAQNREIPGSRVLPARQFAQTTQKQEIQLAQSTVPSSGFVLDYQTLTASMVDFTFAGDTTYYINGDIILSGTTTLEGGAVLKFNKWASGNYMQARITGPFICKTSPFHPAIATAKDDNTVGAAISGSTGEPSGEYAYRGFFFHNTGSAVELSHVSVRFARFGYAFYYNSGHTLRHFQSVANRYGAYLYSSSITLRNGLLDGTGALTSSYGLYGTGTSPSFAGENLTVANYTYLRSQPSGR